MIVKTQGTIPVTAKIESTARLRRHSLATRLVHGGLAISVITQLLTSLAMRGPKVGRPDDLIFVVHEYSGVATLALALAFWITLMTRRRGTDAGALLPWISRKRRAALAADLRKHGRAIASLSLPHYDEHGPLASAVHGLGLLLMTAMAGLGAIWFAAVTFGAGETGAVSLTIAAHKLLGNLIWAYLVGHAGLATLHHFRGEASLSEMWSARPAPTIRGD